MNIKYFAWRGEKIGFAEEEVVLPPEVTDVGMLINWLSTRGPNFENALEFVEVIKVVVNQTYVHNDQPVKNDDEVIFIPPIAGG